MTTFVVGTPVGAQPLRYRAEEIPAGVVNAGPRGATAINRAGAVALWQPRVGPSRATSVGAFTWTPGTLTPLQTGDPTWEAVPYDLSDSGIAVGSVRHPESGLQAVLMSPSKILATLPTFERPAEAMAINGTGQIVGRYEFAPGLWHAFVFSPVEGTRDLGLLAGGFASALDINDSGTIVGEGADLYGNLHAFIRPPDGPMLDLNDVAACGCDGFTLSSAVRVTPGGLVGVNDLTPGAGRAFVLEGFDSYGMDELRPLTRGDYREARLMGLADPDWTGSPVAVGVSAWANAGSSTSVTYVATRWARGGGELRALDLHDRTVNAPTELFVNAVDVNANGQIVVLGAGNGLYRLTPLCSADFDADLELDTADYEGFVHAWESGNSSADYNEDAIVDGVDLGDFCYAYETREGCR